MIIGTITLITILFSGGAIDYFLISGLEKGIKEYVVDKERQKELLAEFKLVKKEIKIQDKKRAKLVKALKQASADYNSGQSELKPFGDSLMKSITIYEDLIIETRIKLIQKIENEEWDKIIEFSMDRVKKEKDKLQQKIDKGKVKDPFEKLQNSIQSQMTSENKKKEVLASFEKFKDQFNSLVKKFNEKNVSDTPVLKEKSASAEDLRDIAEDVNSLRMETFEQMLNFRSDLRKTVNEEEWNKIIKEYNKILK